LQRDYDLLRQHYGDLLKKEQESQMATNLEKRQEGHRFRLADPPNLPTRPSSPKRLLISLIGLAAGVLLGGALAVLIEARNSSFRSVDEVSRRLALPLVVGIPLSLTPVEKSARSRRMTFEWVAGCVVFLAVSTAEYYLYLHQ
jgi:succinoglycan biosynthesis transport protein ExoP